jgi:hypothetical protein
MSDACGGDDIIPVLGAANLKDTDVERNLDRSE